MARTRRHRSTSLLFTALAIALALHGGALQLYAALQPEPVPRLYLHFQGKGHGSVISHPAGLSCAENCYAAFEPGTRVRLVAVVEEDSTFEGWSETCTPRQDWVLECELTLERDTRVEVGFGVVPERVDVAWVRPPESEDKELTVTLPDPELEAEQLTEPAEEIEPELQPEEPPELAKVEPPRPEEAAPAEPAPPPQPTNMRSVEVPDENEVEEAPEDATHLSDKNRDVAEETRATNTNLEREQSGETVSSEENDLQSKEIGAEDDEIAQLEDDEPPTLEESQDDQASDSGEDEPVVGMVTREQGERGDDGQDGDDRPSETPGVLSMRGVEGRGSIVADDSQTGQGGRSGKRGRAGRPGIKTQLEFEDYERIVGKETVKEELALGRRKKKSTRRGRFERKMGAVKAALENFTPEIRPGNQTALKTRAAPFAVYIARMHRRIHELWGFGFLEDLDRKPADHPLNNWDLYTKLELVINPDGTVHKTTIVTHSGILEFDVAAIDVLLTAAPYEPPPKKIRSPDGRVYIHWGFNRNWRQCGTFNAQPFILSEAPADADSVDDSDLVRNVPRRASRRRGKERASGGASAGAASNHAGLPASNDPQAVHVANLWLGGFTHGDASKMLTVTGAPFYSGGSVVANSVGEVGNVYKTILQETRGKLRDWKLMSPAGYRKRFGVLPPGIQDGKPQLLMVVRAGKEQFTLVLARGKNGTYKVTGLHR